MIELLESELKTFNGHSSKGNQLKWQKDNIWYKADYTGYEGLSEYILSGLLAKSNLTIFWFFSPSNLGNLGKCQSKIFFRKNK